MRPGIRLKFVRNTRAAYKARYPQQFSCTAPNNSFYNIVLTKHWKCEYADFRRQIRLRMHTFACYATNLTALSQTAKFKLCSPNQSELAVTADN